MDRTAAEILDALMEEGAMPTEQEVAALCQEVVQGAMATDIYEALVRALDRAGWAVIDVTTDDDDETNLEIVAKEQDNAEVAG